MFDIGFTELILVSVIGLLVLGPERLPGAIRRVSLWLGQLRRSFNAIRADIEREINADEIRQDLHNEAVMQSLKQAEAGLRGGMEAAAGFTGSGESTAKPGQSTAEPENSIAGSGESATKPGQSTAGPENSTAGPGQNTADTGESAAPAAGPITDSKP